MNGGKAQRGQTAVSSGDAAAPPRLRQLWRWLPLLAWMALIFFVSHQPARVLPHAGAWDFLLKKGAHFAAYAILAALAYRAAAGWPRPFLAAFLFTILYAASDEYHQTFIPGRNGTVVDVLIDAAGGLFALIVLALRKRPSRARTTSPRP